MAKSSPDHDSLALWQLQEQLPWLLSVTAGMVETI